VTGEQHADTVRREHEKNNFLLLLIERDAIERLEYELTQRRQRRDRLALVLVDAGYTWRAVAAVAGFKNSYIRHLKKDREALRGGDAA
jgi:hypothetical protein